MSVTVNNKHITIIISGGLIQPHEISPIIEIAAKYSLALYLSTIQNLRLVGATEENLDVIKKELVDLGYKIKGPGQFPKPKVCVGVPYCNLALADTFSLSDKILSRFGDRTDVKPKYKIAISGCPACCGGSKLADIGVIATRKGFDVYAGGKGGPLPRVGSRIARSLTDEQVLELIGTMAAFHNERTHAKQRMFKVMEEQDFPYPREK